MRELSAQPTEGENGKDAFCRYDYPSGASRQIP